MPTKPRYSRADIIKLLKTTGVPESRNSLAILTGMSVPSMYRYLMPMLETGEIYISHTISNSTGGLHERFFLPGPAPEGHVIRELISPEQLAAKAERRKQKQRIYTRTAKKKRREKDRAARLALQPEKIKNLTDEELDWIDPNWRFTPSTYSAPAADLMAAWNPAFSTIRKGA